MSEPLTLNVRFQLEGARLVIEYTVANDSPEEIFLTNHGVRYEPNGPVPDRNQAWVFFESGVVHVTQRRPDRPQDGFRQPVPHFVTPVKPRGRFRQELTLPLPLVEVRPYREEKASGARRVYPSVFFSVGFERANRWFVPAEIERAGHRVWVLRSRLKEKPPPSGPVEIPEEEFLISEKVAIDLPVLETRW